MPPEMSTFERLVALAARIDTLERHAMALHDAFRHPDLKAEAASLIARIRRIRLAADRPLAAATADLDEIERNVDAASILLTSLGRST